MAINGPIVAANMLPRGNPRITAVPLVKAAPPNPYYTLLEDVSGIQLLRTVDTTNMLHNQTEGNYETNTVANPVNGDMNGDTWEADEYSILWFDLPFVDLDPGYYTYSLYARGILPAGGSSLTLFIQETRWFARSTGLVGLENVTVPNGIWKRFSLTVYIPDPTVQYRIAFTMDPGYSIDIACFQWEPGTIATAWRGSPGPTPTSDIYTEVSQLPEREGQMVGRVSSIPSETGLTTAANLYVVVKIDATLVWKPVVGIVGTIDPRTGKAFDPLLDFYSALA